MPFFAYSTDAGRPTGQNVVYQGTSISEGFLASSHEATSQRALSKNWIRENYPTYWWNFWNRTLSGSNSWDALARLSPLVLGHGPGLILTDWTNDAAAVSHDRFSREVWIRRVWTDLPNCNLVVTLWPEVNPDGTLNATHSKKAEFSGLCSHYGVSLVDVHAEIYQLVMIDGDPITNYYDYPADRLHPLDAGHQVGMDLLQPLLPGLLFGSRQFGGTLPARYYAGSDAYEHTPTTYIDGTDYNSQTGTWTESGGTISSNEAGATVTYTRTCASFGYESEVTPYPAFEYSIDGGAFQNGSSGHQGVSIGSYGNHTIILRVKAGTTLRIDKFLAV